MTDYDSYYSKNSLSTINEFGVVGEWGFVSNEGPYEADKEGTIWVIYIPSEDAGSMIHHLTDLQGEGSVILSDGEIIGGGILVDVFEPEGEEEIHVVIDQYAMGDPHD